MLQWKSGSAGRKALLIEGARRIGKSTIAEEFARHEYRSYILIDFNNATRMVKDAFESHLNDLDTFFMLLQTEYGVTLYPHESLIVFDEIQMYPKARQSVKLLVADGRYDYMETGSLLSIRENVKDITIPSEERSIKMYPMDFEEFCWALGESKLMEYVRRCFDTLTPPDNTLHRKAMLLFRQYMLVGGMPQSLNAYIGNNRSFALADEEKRDILSLYRNDMMKIGRSYRSRVVSIFDQIPSFLSKHEKRVTIKGIEKNATYDNYEETFFWLANSMIANECFNCNDPKVGLSLNEDRSYLKCYMGDTGLLVSHTFDENEIASEELYKNIIGGKLSLNEGMLFENVVAQMLVAAGHRLFFYTHYNAEKHRNDIEIDFIISNKSKTNYKLYPVEVKSTTRYTTVSLDRFMEKFHERVARAYVIHTGNLAVKGNSVHIPAYMAICL